jgi:hypothetical protein
MDDPTGLKGSGDRGRERYDTIQVKLASGPPSANPGRHGWSKLLIQCIGTLGEITRWYRACEAPHSRTSVGKPLAELAREIAFHAGRRDRSYLAERPQAIRRLHGGNRPMKQVDVNCCTMTGPAATLALGLWRRLVQPERDALAVSIETRDGPTQRHRFVPLEAEALGDHSSPKGEDRGPIDLDDIHHAARLRTDGGRCLDPDQPKSGLPWPPGAPSVGTGKRGIGGYENLPALGHLEHPGNELCDAAWVRNRATRVSHHGALFKCNRQCACAPGQAAFTGRLR